MKYVVLISIALLSCCSIYGQDGYAISLPKENSALTVPSLARRGAKIYVAYRSFNWLRFSNRLEVLEYDQETRRLLRHVTIPVPKVHGARAGQGFSLSEDGRMLAYVEAYHPRLLILLSTRDLSVIRESTKLPFAAEDHSRILVGFCDHNLLAFASVMGDDRLRFVRVLASNLDVASTKTMPGPQVFAPAWKNFVWLPLRKLVWINQYGMNSDPDAWHQYTEGGEPTGGKLTSRYVAGYGAVALGTKGLVSFNGDMVAKGAVLLHSERRTAVLNLPCVPSPYGVGADKEYLGALCATVTDRSEPAHNKLLTSEFLLLKTSPLKVIWHHPMRPLAVANGNEPNAGFQEARPLIFRSGKQVWIVAPSSKPELKVYIVTLSQ